MLKSMRFLAVAVVAGLTATTDVQSQRETGVTMPVAEAHAKALAGEIVLVDVRTPQEWKETGIPATAHAITMHQDARPFLSALKNALGNNLEKPLAIICRTGNRTSSLYPELKRAGFKSVINVVEGVAGGPYGAGWSKSGLPLRDAAQPRMTSLPR
jgi:rhodanese-related sulfurtransferase